MQQEKCAVRLHRMPYGFGPTCGPRQGPDGLPFDWRGSGRLTVGCSFLTDAAALQALLPPGFTLAGEPVVTVEFHALSSLAWLAGRGYSMLQVKFPARFAGKEDNVTGSFLCVLWENLADPILSGREELGFAKLWCELPPPRTFGDRVTCDASWLAHPFAELTVGDLVEAEPKMPPLQGMGALKSDGTLHYKYLPATPAWDKAAVEHACLSPAVSSAGSPMKVERLRVGTGSVKFLPTTWEQMPTQFHIVSALAALPQREQRGGLVAELRGGSDYADQRRLG